MRRRNAKKHPTFAKFGLTFAKKVTKNAKKCKKLQKTSFHPHKPPFLTTPKIKNPIFSQISRGIQNTKKNRHRNDTG